MSERIAIISLEDEPEVRQAILRDLEPFTGSFRIEGAEDADDARELIASIAEEGDRVGLILCDHRLPGISGVEFLTELQADESTRSIRKVLLTGQADHADTIQAINSGGLHHYLTKPWRPEELDSVVRQQLTDFVLDAPDIDPLPYVQSLDGVRLMAKVAAAGTID